MATNRTLQILSLQRFHTVEVIQVIPVVGCDRIGVNHIGCGIFGQDGHHVLCYRAALLLLPLLRCRAVNCSGRDLHGLERGQSRHVDSGKQANRKADAKQRAQFGAAVTPGAARSVSAGDQGAGGAPGKDRKPDCAHAL